jgi:mitochondrial import inner membrane translocase subunit TIM8
MDVPKFDEATQACSLSLLLLLLHLFNSHIQRELATFIEKEQAQARVQDAVHKLTSMCWDKCAQFPLSLLPNSSFRIRCITGAPSTRFSRGEESCLNYCVDRFLDTSLRMVQLIQEQRKAANVN